MKNLLTKILFISLLLSVAMPSGVQASLFTEKFGRVALGTGVGTVVGTVVGIVATTLEEIEAFKKRKMTAAETIAILAWGAAGAAIGATGTELALGTEGVVAAGAGVGAAIGLVATGLSERWRGLMGIKGLIGAAVGGAGVGAAMVRKIKAKYLSRRMTANEIIGRAQTEQK